MRIIHKDARGGRNADHEIAGCSRNAQRHSHYRVHDRNFDKTTTHAGKPRYVTGDVTHQHYDGPVFYAVTAEQFVAKLFYLRLAHLAFRGRALVNGIDRHNEDERAEQYAQKLW